MQRGHVAPIGTLALAATLALGSMLVAPEAHAEPVRDPGHRAYTFAVIGDVPYGAPAEAHFPDFVAGINEDPDVQTVTHLGDIKSGSTTCDDERFETVREAFDDFEDPLVYTPGDNEWTDCHRANNGTYHPLERLAKIRALFFDDPGTTLGDPVPVRSQAHRGLPENVRYTRGGLSFATLHVVGSNDDLLPWTGLGATTATEEQVKEERHRMAADIANVRAAFRTARAHRLRGVVLMQQADMFDPNVPNPRRVDYRAFRPLVRTLVAQSRRFDGPVYLFNGDSHRFNQDRPLRRGSSWLDFYRVRRSADNLHRLTVDGANLGEADWLKVRVRRGGGLTVERVPGA